MASISGSNSYSTAAYSNKGMSGLASGLDTEGMVESMLAGIQKKIDAQNSMKQQTLWKQELYRSVITDLNTFQTKFFATGSSTNFLSNSFYNLMSATTKSNAIKVTADSSAATGKTKISVEQLATKSSVKSGGEVSGGLEGSLNLSSLSDRTVVLDVEGTEVNVDLSLPAGATELSAEEMTKRFNDAFTAAGLTGVTASMKGEKLTLNGGMSSITVSGKSSALGLTMTGVSAGAAAKFDTENFEYKLISATDRDAQPTIDVQLDGIKKTITLSGATEAEFQDNLQKSLNRAFGENALRVNITGGKIALDTNGIKGREVYISGTKAGLEAMGMKEYQSNKITTSFALKDLNFNTKLMGSTFEFEINGEKFSFSENDTLSSIIAKVNNSKAGVRIVYAAGEDKFTIESSESGAGFNLEMKQTKGNLLTALLGNVTSSPDFATGSDAVGKTLTTNSFSGTAGSGSFKSGDFVINVDGKDYTINFPAKAEDAAYTNGEIVTGINERLGAMFGYGKDGKQNIEISMTGDDVKVGVNNGASVKVVAAKEPGKDAGAQLGLVGSGNAAGSTTKLADITGLGTAFAGSSLTVGDLLASGATVADGKITFATLGDAKTAIEGIGTAEQQKALKIKLFGTDDFSKFETTADTSVSMGVNAKLTINGVETERSSNIFTVDGLSIELLETTKNATDPTKYDDIIIDTTRNTDGIFDGVKSFVEEYNKLIDKLNKLVGAKATYKEYDPLTDDQKKELSDREITLWEEKAKEGLLRNDSSISSVLSSMRLALYTKPAGASMALYDFGIETSNNWKDQGKLVIKDEAALKSAIASNPTDFQKLFSDAQEGVMKQINAAIDVAAKTSSGSKGSLVELAGVAGRATDNDNTLSKRITDINDRIKTLKNTYEVQKARYWKQFNSMESAISSLNNQSSWLMQQFGG